MTTHDRADAAMPHDDARSEAQCQWLVAACSGRRVLDLGCGDGRVARVVAPVAQQYVAIDNDPEAIRRCREAAIDATVIQGDLCDPPIDARFHFVLCVGNTFSLLWDVDQAVLALKRWRLRLHRPDGAVVIDDLADDLWPELAEGRWCAGLDETEGRQLVWARDDAVFAVRDGEAVDLEQWHPTSADRRMRLWTAGSLRLVAAAAGYLPPQRLEAGGVLILRPTPPTPAD